MSTLTHASVFDALQEEFCPPLDSSLVAALLADVDFDSTENPEPAPRPASKSNGRGKRNRRALVPDSRIALQQAIEALRQTLKELAAQAEVDALHYTSLFEDEGNSLSHTDDRTTVSGTCTSDLDRDNNGGTTNDQTSSSSKSPSTGATTNSSNMSDSDSLTEAFTSPLGFLQATLPHIPTKQLRKALKEAENELEARRVCYIDEPLSPVSDGSSNSGLDMWDLIASILTAESIREMEERGFEGLLGDEARDAELARLLSEEGEYPNTQPNKQEEWIQVKKPLEKKQQPRQQPPKAKTLKITLNDVRQKGSNNIKKPNTIAYESKPDRWTQVVSLSSLLATLFPSYPASFFQSYFQSPNYPDSYQACCAVLNKICGSSNAWLVNDTNGQINEPKRISEAEGPEMKTPELPYPPLGKSKTRMRTARDGHRHPPPINESGGGDPEDSDNSSARDTVLLFNLLDVLLPEYGLEPGQDGTSHPEAQERNRTQLISEIQLAVQATQGKEDDALDVVKLLRALDEERNAQFSGLMEEFYRSGTDTVGVGGGLIRKGGLSYADSLGAPRKRGTSSNAFSGPNGFAVNGAADGRMTGSRASYNGNGMGNASDPANTIRGGVRKAKGRPSPYQWQAVPVKKALEKAPATLLPHLPTYTRDVNGITRRGSVTDPSYVRTRGLMYLAGEASVPGAGPSSSGPVKSYASEAEAAEKDYRRKIGENMKRRDELLREAARMWTRGVGGNGARLAGGDKTKTGRSRGGNVGGEVALYFAERAREFQEMARKESLNAARAMVHRKRAASGDSNSIDLHGTTVVEALAIIREVLHEQPTSQARPLKIITGKGSHSVNHTSVLKPALKNRLTEDGWVVGMWEAGLVVRGRR